MHFSLPYALKYVLAFVGRGELELARIVLSCIQNNYVNACVQVRVRASVRVCVLIDYAALTPPTPLLKHRVPPKVTMVGYGLAVHPRFR